MHIHLPHTYTHAHMLTHPPHLHTCTYTCTPAHTEELSKQVDTTGDVYFVPAFSGLYAPYWQPDARGYVLKVT